MTMPASSLHDDDLLIVEAFGIMYPDRPFPYTPRTQYSGRFSDYSANMRLHGGVLELRLSPAWREVSRDIRIGLIQELLLKVLRDRRAAREPSLYRDLYGGFVRNLHIAVPKTHTHPTLEASFARVNEAHFLGLVEKPNLVWGQWSRRKLGSYSFKDDTISMSKVFLDIGDDTLLDHVMYHEMLHKQVKFTSSGGRNRYHTAKFRALEKGLYDHDEVEKRLALALRRVRRKRDIGHPAVPPQLASFGSRLKELLF